MRYASITAASGTPSPARWMPSWIAGAGSNRLSAAIAVKIGRMFAAQLSTITSNGTGVMGR